MTSKKSTEENDFQDNLFSLDQRPMTSGRHEEQLANDFTNEDLARFLP